jgi:[ribosomal protein S5]-alanine N-acetyltransferase
VSVENILRTNRLSLRPYTAEHAPDLFDIFRDERAMRFMPTLPHKDAVETEAYLHAEASRPGAYLWSIFLKDESKAIGQVHILGETRLPGMGYIIHPDYWGKGIAPEACRAALPFVFENLGCDRIELWIDETNTASLRVAQKLGFMPKGRIALKYNHETSHHFMLVYGMLSDEWRGSRASQAPTATRFFSGEPVLRVADVRLTADYYRDQLGFHIDFLYGDPPTHGAVSRGEWTGSMVTVQLSQAPPERRDPSASYLYIFVDTSLDALCESFRGRGVTITAEPKTQPWGLREFAIRDLNGHTLVFATHA